MSTKDGLRAMLETFERKYQDECRQRERQQEQLTKMLKALIEQQRDDRGEEKREREEEEEEEEEPREREAEGEVKLQYLYPCFCKS